jgi:ASC-1-like (ASCH) protein
MFSKYIPTANFDAIVNGQQKYIAKIDSGFWKSVKVGTRIILTDGQRETPVEVKEVSYFSNFDDAWFKFGDALVPSHICNINKFCKFIVPL